MSAASTLLVAASAVFFFAACSPAAGPPVGDEPTSGGRAPGEADVIEGGEDDGTITVGALPSGSTEAPATPPATSPAPTPPAPVVPTPINPDLVLPLDCMTHMEVEPNDNNPRQLPTRVCGQVASNDVDRYDLDVREGNPFVLWLDGPSTAPYAEVRGTCIPERRLTIGERMRLEPKGRNCTVHVNVFSPKAAAYVLRRDK